MKAFAKKYTFELAIFGLLMLYLVQYMPVIDETIGWCLTPYALSYKYGFISRGFIGSIIRFFIPNLKIHHIYVIVALNTLLLCVLTVVFLSVVKKMVYKENHKFYDDNQRAFLFVVLLFVLNPASVAFLFYWGNYGRFDLIMILILLISALLIMKNRGLFFIPLMSIAGILTHQAYVFMYFPALMMLLLYAAFIRNQDKNENRKEIKEEDRKEGRKKDRGERKKQNKAVAVFWITGITTCIAFLYMQFFSGVVGYDYESMMADINATTELPAKFIYDDMMVRLEYFTSVFATIQAFVIDPLPRNLFKIACVIVLCLPVLAFFRNVWKDFMEGRSKWLWVIPWSGMIGMIPKFLMTNDYGRDFSALIISQFVMIFTFLALGDSGMKEAFRKLTARIAKNPLLYIALLIYIGAIGKFEAANILEIAERIFILFEKILGLD